MLGYYTSIYSYRYRLIENENNAHPYIEIYNFDNIDDILELNKLMNTYGWYAIDIIDKYNKPHHEKSELKNFKEVKNIFSIIYRAKFDIEIDKKFWPRYLYHVSPSKNLDKINRYGLIPKSESKVTGHEDHIYLYDISDDKFTLEELAEEIHKSGLKEQLDKPKKNIPDHYKNKYVVFKIDMEMQKDYFRLFADPDLTDSYFTLDNISSLSIHLEEIINLKI
jgi:hypothetical protein